MQKFSGKSVYGGIAIGRISYFRKEKNRVLKEKIRNQETEILRLEQAREQAMAELKVLYQKALENVGKANAEIFRMHRVILEDPAYLDAIYRIIREENFCAEYAVAVTGEEFARKFLEMEDDYTQERASDIRDVSQRLIDILEGENEFPDMGVEPVILLAEDLSPSQMIQLDRTNVLTVVTRFGSRHSHMAILARSMGIPAIVCVDFPEDVHQKYGIVDGFQGVFYLEPDETVLETYREKQQEGVIKKQLLQTLKGKANRTKNGREIEVYANIGSVADIADVIGNDAGGIGLFRTELLFMEKTKLPEEEEQFHTYRAIARGMKGKNVIIRTLDIGADKQPEYFHLEKEENPALGCRGIRLCLGEPELFKTQLRAIFRASNYGNLSIMYPMISSLKELKAIRELTGEVKTELKSKGIPFQPVKEGVMIETPAAAILADELGKEVDFFSIGTNDLSQYVLAMDRQNVRVEPFFDPHHPAILKLVEWVVAAGHRQGCQVGICGELAADPELTGQFLDMGVDALSVAPSKVLPLRQRIRELD